MKKSKAAVILVAILAAFAGLAYYASIILSSTGIGEEMSIPLGLDLSGGVSITYQVMDENPSAEDMSDTIYKLQKRVESYSTEASVYQVGDDRIAVEIPGVTDASKILEELGNPGSLEFQLSDGTVFMTGDQVADAQAATTTDQYGNKQYVVQLTLTDEGAKTFGEVTSENVGKALPIVYDGEVISYPTVQEAITGGTAQISGQSTFEEAQTFSNTDQNRFSFPAVIRVRVQCGRSTAWKPGNLLQFKSGSNRSCDRNGIYDHCICSSGCRSSFSTCNLYSTCDCNFILIRDHINITWYCRYYLKYWYGSGCERYHLCTYP